MRRSCSGVAIAALIAASALAVPRASHAQRASAATTTRLDTLAAQLIELELERVSSASKPTGPVAAAGGGSASRIDSLHVQLRALPEGAAAEREAMSRVILALDARASALRARIREARLYFTDEHPMVRQSLSEVQAIGQRVTEIRNAR